MFTVANQSSVYFPFSQYQCLLVYRENIRIPALQSSNLFSPIHTVLYLGMSTEAATNGWIPPQVAAPLGIVL